MIHSQKIICVLDTNVIYSIWIRDILLWFAYYDLYIPKWSRHIMNEWMEVLNRKGISKSKATKRLILINEAFPDALIENYESLIKSLRLPDKKDNHVLAAAIRTNATLIITNNLKDFPNGYLTNFKLLAINPDEFLSEIITLNNEISVNAFNELVNNKRNPSYSKYEVLDILRKNGLNKTTEYLQELL